MIAVETMVSRLEAGDTRRRAATYAFKTTAFPMLTGTLVMIAGFIPVGFASSSAGEYCFSLFAVVLMALLSSWIVAILFSPLTGAWLLPEKLKHHAAGPGRMARGYGRLLRTALRHRLATLGIALAVLGLSVYGTTFMQGSFSLIRSSGAAGQPDAAGQCFAVCYGETNGKAGTGACRESQY